MNSHSVKSLGLIIVMLVACTGTLLAREFTDSQGRKLEADLVSVAAGQVTLKRSSDGRVFTMPVAQFSAADQQVMNDFAKANVRYAFDVKYARTRLGKQKSRQGVVTFETEEWAYKVSLINKSSVDAADVKINYWLFRRADDGKNKSGPRVQQSGSVSVPLIRKAATHEFQTASVMINKEQLDADYYYPDGARNKAADSVGGLVMRVMQGDKEIYSYATKDDLLPLAQGQPQPSSSAAGSASEQK